MSAWFNPASSEPMAILSKMDDDHAFRGYDFILEQQPDLLSAGRVPQPAVEKHRGPWFRQYGNRARRLPGTVGRPNQRVVQMTARNHPEVAPPRLAGIREEVGDL